MRRILLALLCLLPIHAVAQSVPMDGTSSAIPSQSFPSKIQWTPQQWRQAWGTKADLIHPTFNGATITNYMTIPSWSSGTRPATAAVGSLGINTTSGTLDLYTSAGWANGSSFTGGSIPNATSIGNTLGVTGAVSLSSTLGVSGAATLSGTGTGLAVSNNQTIGGVLELSAGTSALPSYAFTGDLTTGAYLPAAGQLGFAAAAASVADYGATTASKWTFPTAVNFTGSGTGLTVTNGFSLNGGGSLGGTITGAPTWSAAQTFVTGTGVAGQLNVGTTLNLGTQVGAGSNATIQTPNGSNIVLNPQGSGIVKIGSSGTGTMDAGVLNIGGINYTGASGTGPLFSSNENFTGSDSSASIIGANGWTVNSDNLTKTGQLLTHSIYNYNFGGTGYSGSRGVMVLNLTQTGASSGNGTAQTLQASVSLTHSWGGTNTYSSAAGSATGLNSYVKFTSGYTNGNGGSGEEIDIEPQSGSTFGALAGLLISHTSAAGASGSLGQDAAFATGDQDSAAVQWNQIIQVSSRGNEFPLASTGTVLKVELGRLYNSVPSSFTNGIDLLLGTISGSAYRSPSFSVDGSGNIQTGTCYLNNGSNGADLDCSGSIGTAVSLVSGGSSWPTNASSYYATDSNGGVYKVTLSGGAVTALSIYRAPVSKGSTPSNPVTLTPDAQAAAWGATGLTANITWAARALLRLNPSGGDILFGSGTQFSGLGATAGFIHLPYTNGTSGSGGIPTGTPANTSGPACVWNDVTFVLDCYSPSAGAWKHISFSAGAG